MVRNVRGRKHSKYAPTEGNRYDGIYKVSRPCPHLAPAPAPTAPPPPPLAPLAAPSQSPDGAFRPAGREVLAGEREVRLLGVALSPAEGRQ